MDSSTAAAVEALRRGYQAVPIRTGTKAPHIPAWTQTRWRDEEEVRAAFDRWNGEGVTGIGLVLGRPSGGLVDVDLDHPRAARLWQFFLPPTGMMSGRAGRPFSHHWYLVTDDPETMPGTRQYRMPDGSMGVELRSTGAQTVIPPSVHPSGEKYLWTRDTWGEPLRISGRKLEIQVALLGLATVLLDAWPKRGSRHDAYLALAGALLKDGTTVHSWWEANLPVLIGGMAEATHDEDGADTRVKEVMSTTLNRIRGGVPEVVGWGRLADLLGTDFAEQARRLAREVEALSGSRPRSSSTITYDGSAPSVEVTDEALKSSLPSEKRDPLGEREGITWQPVDLGPYLSGSVLAPRPTILERSDGVAMFYEGRVNSLYGQSEAAKSWVALIACQQEIAKGLRVMYLDFEDEPTFTLSRLLAIGMGDDDIRNSFTYLHPEDGLADLQVNQWGQPAVTERGRANARVFWTALDERIKPNLLVVDGMTALYTMHGMDTNKATDTERISQWLKRLTRGGLTTVIVIDHTGKGSVRGSAPIGAHHKIAMIQGTALQVVPVEQPMPGVRGEVHLLVFKDRPGAVRAESTRTKPATAAVVILDSRSSRSTEPGSTVVSVLPPSPPDKENVVIGDESHGGQAAVDRGAAKVRRMAEERRRQEEKDAKTRADQEFREDVRRTIIECFGGDLDARKSHGALRKAVHDADLAASDHLIKKVRDSLLAESVLHKYGKPPAGITYGLDPDDSRTP